MTPDNNIAAAPVEAQPKKPGINPHLLKKFIQMLGLGRRSKHSKAWAQHNPHAAKRARRKKEKVARRSRMNNLLMNKH